MLKKLFRAALSVMLKSQKPPKLPITIEQLHKLQLCRLKRGLQTLANMGNAAAATCGAERGQG